ncbi:cupin domain-containing protein [Kibdelosporangium persicum]|uniref:Cupin domain n=1 Tax=Kibdelosporangium persicum TaxID=2698649 RepID=A0ABX2EVJ5_9PSEU|nr:cupin domain-containing protein [Kibdelosporangium persicum]NRN62973.1 Cupin domain [Kibdelosporangium persicum]
MIVVTTARTVETPNAAMASLATPSLGSKEQSTWRVSMRPGAQGPVHAVDREQVWVLLDGAVEFVVDGSANLVRAGETAILPAGETRQVRVADGPVEALVCMPVGGSVTLPGSDDRRPLPWAE